jgi:hypothetical protein
VREPVVIERRFRGPPNSAQGGYAAGLLAEQIDGPAMVSLRLPPPLERRLELRRDLERAVALMDGDRLVAEGNPAELDLELPDPVSYEEALRASADCPWTDRHPFPGCFGCGPERSRDEALAIAMGPVAGRDLFAAAWTPSAGFAGADGALAPRFVWAALDCPSAAPHLLHTPACVLARLTGCLQAPVLAGRPHTVLSWPIDHDGRKHRAGTAIFGSDGELCASAEGLWVELRDPASMDVQVALTGAQPPQAPAVDLHRAVLHVAVGLPFQARHQLVVEG